MFAIEVTSEFCASHQLRLPDGALEPLHGHNFRVAVRLVAERLDELDTVLDFHAVEAALAPIINAWNNHHLNDIAPFTHAVNPSAERIAEQLGLWLAAAVAKIPGAAARGVRVAEVRVTEAPHCLAIWLAD